MSIHTKLKTNKFLNYKTILSILVSVLGIWLGFRDFDFHGFKEAFLSINLYYFFLSMFVVIFTVYLRAFRWKYLILPIKKVPVMQLFKMEMIGYFGNNVFPLKMGEMLRAYTLGEQEDMSSVSVFGTIVSERLLDTLVFAIFIALGVLFFPDFPEWTRQVGVGAIASLVIFAIGVTILNFKKHFIKGFWEKIKGKYHEKKYFGLIEKLIDGMTTLFTTPNIGKIIVQSLLIWGITVANFWVLGWCLNVTFSFSDVILIFITTSFVFAVPSAPGYVGTYHAAAISILVYLGIATSEAQVLAVIMHGVGYISMTLIGLVYFLRFHISVKDVEIAKE